MKTGQASQTAVLVCMARAAANDRVILGAAEEIGNTAPRFSDPTAFELLPQDAQERVESFRSASPPRGVRAGFQHAFLDKRSKMMAVRTVAIDRAMLEAGAPQLVILGAGLDGRAFRMPELRDVRVFEVDHPNSQKDKRERAARLTLRARDVHFVPVDFRRDNLDDALQQAGHDPTRPTTWIWEGVVMYLTRAEVEASLSVIDRRSATGSRLIVAYFAPAPILWLVGPFLRRLGEPVRSVFAREQMAALLAEHHFEVARDQNLPAIALELSDELARGVRPLEHLRIVTADRRDAATSLGGSAKPFR